MLGVCSRTIRRWDAAGKISCTRTPGGHRRLSLAIISDQVFQFESLEADSPIQKIFVIDILDWSSYNRYNYNSALQELIFDTEDHEDVEFYLIDLSLNRILRVNIGFFQKFASELSSDGNSSSRALYDRILESFGRPGMLHNIRIVLTLGFSLKWVEILMNGADKVEYHPHFIEGVENLWGYDQETGEFIELTIQKAKDED